jgi:hypothetical protein
MTKKQVVLFALWGYMGLGIGIFIFFGIRYVNKYHEMCEFLKRYQYLFDARQEYTEYLRDKKAEKAGIHLDEAIVALGKYRHNFPDEANLLSLVFSAQQYLFCLEQGDAVKAQAVMDRMRSGLDEKRKEHLAEFVELVKTLNRDFDSPAYEEPL